MALAWSVLYAVVVGSAAFAGERETGTLRLLDILPAARPVVWAGKFSFRAVHHDGADRPALRHGGVRYRSWGYFDGLALLFTGDSKSLLGAMPRAGRTDDAGLGTVLVVDPQQCIDRRDRHGRFHCDLHDLFDGESTWKYCDGCEYHQEDQIESPNIHFHELVVILAILVASNLLFTRTRDVRRLPFQFQSPIVMTPADPEHAEPSDPASVAGRSGDGAGEWPRRATVDQLPRRSRRAESCSLVWETAGECETTWCLLAVIGLVVPLPFYVSMLRLEPCLCCCWTRSSRWWRGSTSLGWRTEGGPNGSSLIMGCGRVWSGW